MVHLIVLVEQCLELICIKIIPYIEHFQKLIKYHCEENPSKLYKVAVFTRTL